MKYKYKIIMQFDSDCEITGKNTIKRELNKIILGMVDTSVVNYKLIKQKDVEDEIYN